MVSLTVRNIPQALLERIRVFARGERRSVNSELLVLLEEGLRNRQEGQGRKDSASSSILARSRVWGELCGSWRGDSQSTALLLEEALRLRTGNGISTEGRPGGLTVIEDSYDPA